MTNSNLKLYFVIFVVTILTRRLPAGCERRNFTPEEGYFALMGRESGLRWPGMVVYSDRLPRLKPSINIWARTIRFWPRFDQPATRPAKDGSVRP